MYRWYDEDDCKEATSLLESLLGYIRAEFGDRATLFYPWLPEDYEPNDLEWELFRFEELEADALAASFET
jgi:hypothetical protein